MADYVRFRWTTAKVGVSMALLALVAGAADRARAAGGQVKVAPALQFLKLTGLSKTIGGDFLKVEAKLVKLNNAISSLDQKWVKLDRNLTQNYLTVKKADSSYLKLTDASAQYLKLTDASAQYLKIADASAQYLKVADASAQYLKLSDAAKFFQTTGSLVSGAVSNVTTTPQQLVSLPGGIIVVNIAQVAGVPGETASLTIHNGTAEDLVAVGDTNGTPQQTTLKAGQDTLLPAVQRSTTEIRIQIFPGKTFTNVVSILIGLTPNPTTQQTEAVAQAFTGGV